MSNSVRKTRFQQLHLIITFVMAAAAITFCLLTEAELYSVRTVVKVIIAIIVSYAVGQAVRMYLAYVLKPDEPEAEEVLEGQELSVSGDDNIDSTYSDAYAEFDEANR